MDEGKDIVGISACFCAGVIVGACCGGGCLRHPAVPAAVQATVLALAFIIFPTFPKKLAPQYSRILVHAMFLLAGIFCSVNHLLLLGSAPPAEAPLKVYASMAAERLKGLIADIPFPHSGANALVQALLTGDRSSLGKDVTGIFRESGASHILALSGLHMGIIYMIFSKLTSLFGNSPAACRARYALTCAAAGFYTLMTGASPSTVRALYYILLGETAKVLHRERDPLGVLSAALAFQLALSPGEITSAGFQLSYLAMTGITLLYPILDKMYPSCGMRFDPMRKIWQAAALSISCQAFTAPLAYARFHTFPQYFLLTNLLALPLTTAIMAVSVSVIILFAAGICPQLLIDMDGCLVDVLVFCLETISDM